MHGFFISTSIDQYSAASCTLFDTVAIGNPKQHVRKASHCSSKQQ